MGSSSKPQTLGYRYFMSIHMGLSAGPINEVKEIEVGGRTAWKGSATGQARWQIKASGLFGGDSGEGGIYGTIDMMLGTEDQPVNPRLQRMLGSALVPAFRGVTTFFYDGLIASMNPYPKPWAFRVRRVTAGWDGNNVWYPTKSTIWLGGDTISAMNGAHIIYEAITNRQWGRGRSANRIDDASFRAAADTLFDEGLGLCLCWRRQDSLSELISTVLDHIGGALIDDLQTGKLILRLIRADYDVDDLLLFDEKNGLLGIEQDDSAGGSGAVNEVVVRFTDMMNGGESNQVRVQNLAGIQQSGAINSETVDYSCVPTSGLALRLAQRDLSAKSAATRRFKIRLDRRAYSVLPGGVIRIRSLRRGYEQLVLRVGRVELGKLSEGTITVTAVQDYFGMPLTSYVEVQPPTVKPPTNEPLPATIVKLFEVPYFNLAAYLTAADLSRLTKFSCALALAARRPSTAAQGFVLATRVGSAAYDGVSEGVFCPTAQITIDLDYHTTSCEFTFSTDLSYVQAGDSALINDEIVRIDSINIDTGALVIARGCGDTIPAKHKAGDRIWFYSQDAAVDPAEYTTGVTVHAKVQTHTTSGLLDLALAPQETYLFKGRQARPYPPGRFRIGGQSYPAGIVGDVVLTWANRDRVQQADQLIDTHASSVGPEAGTTYTARLLRASNNSVLTTQTGITANTVTLATTYEGEVIVELWAVRDGLESWQKWQHKMMHTNPIEVP